MLPNWGGPTFVTKSKAHVSIACKLNSPLNWIFNTFKPGLSKLGDLFQILNLPAWRRQWKPIVLLKSPKPCAMNLLILLLKTYFVKVIKNIIMHRFVLWLLHARGGSLVPFIFSFLVHNWVTHGAPKKMHDANSTEKLICESNPKSLITGGHNKEKDTFCNACWNKMGKKLVAGAHLQVWHCSELCSQEFPKE